MTVILYLNLLKSIIIKITISFIFFKVFKRVKVISGDVGVENLGLSSEDRAHLVKNINVIFHSAATLDFADSLRDTVNVNLLGTRRITELAKECEKLEVLVHVSSAYANAFKLELNEVKLHLFVNSC